MKNQPRYAAFLKQGGGENWEYINFISKMVRNYNLSRGVKADSPIDNHRKFTDFIEEMVNEKL